MSPRTIFTAVIAIVSIVVFLILNPLVQIGAGERGVVLVFGAFEGKVLSPGLHWRTPIVQRVIQMDVQTQKTEKETIAYSEDLQQVTVKLALNYSLKPDGVGILYQDIGLDFSSRIIEPSIEESVKQSVAQFTAEELISRRGEVKEEIKNALKERLSLSHITAQEFSITDFSFSDQFENAVEAKVTAEQEALAAKNKLEQVKFEAQQKIETAKADAESIRIQGDALRQNSQLVDLRAVEKWDGKLPTQMIPNATLPFINLK